MAWRMGMRGIAVLTLALATLAGRAAAQSVLERPPNMTGTWTGEHGVIYFNFLHRFTASDAPARKVTNVPTFLLAASAPAHTLFGFRYATSSQLVAQIPNEWEFFGRINPLAQARGKPLDVALHAGWNHAAESFDAELSLSRQFGRLRLLGAARFFSNAFASDESNQALAGGAVLALTPGIAIAGDYAKLVDSNGADAAWGVGLQLRIPSTPHTLSLQATNTNSGTLQGTAAGTGTTRYGFEFTIPITLSRFFGHGAAAGAPVRMSGDTVRIIIQNLAWTAASIEIDRGATVIWENRDAVTHTSTADDGRWDSGNIDAGRSWSRTFTDAGTFAYHCTPHPFMKGTIVVR